MKKYLESILDFILTHVMYVLPIIGLSFIFSLITPFSYSQYFITLIFMYSLTILYLNLS